MSSSFEPPDDDDAPREARIRAIAGLAPIAPKHVDEAVRAADAEGVKTEELVALARVGARLVAAARRERTGASEPPSRGRAPDQDAPPDPTTSARAGRRRLVIAAAGSAALLALFAYGLLRGPLRRARGGGPMVTLRTGEKCRIANARVRYAYVTLPTDAGPMGGAVAIEPGGRATERADLALRGAGDPIELRTLREIRFHAGTSTRASGITRIELERVDGSRRVFDADAIAAGGKGLEADPFVVFGRGERPPVGATIEMTLVADSLDPECKDAIALPLRLGGTTVPLRVELR